MTLLRPRVLGAALLAFALLHSASATAEDDLVFGPEICRRGGGTRTVLTFAFAAAEPSRGHVLKVFNGGLGDTTFPRVSGATIILNGKTILGAKRLNRQVRKRDVRVRLRAQNTLKVKLTGKRGSGILLQLFPLVVIDTPAPGAVVAADAVDVAGRVFSRVASVSVNGRLAAIAGSTFTVVGVPLVEGGNLLAAKAVRSDFSGTASVTVARDTTAPAIAVTAPREGAVVAGPAVDISGSVDDPDAILLVDGAPVPLSGGLFSVTGRALQPGANEIPLEARDGAGNRSALTLHVTCEPPAFHAALSVADATIALGGATTLSWRTARATTVLIEPGIGLVPAAGEAPVSPAATTTYRLTAIGPEGVAVAEARLAVLGSPAPPPEGSFGGRYRDLVPEDATLAAYAPERFSLVTGAVTDRDGAPIAGVLAGIEGRPELGTALTGADGRYTLPVEGGGVVTVALRKPGLLAAHRTVDVAPNDVAAVATVVMLAEDPAATPIFLDGDPASVFVHAGTPVTDEAGTRAATLVLTGDTRVYARTEAGEIEVTAFDLRATEYATPSSMPAHLPPASAFTYCVDLRASGLERVRFSRPAALYVDNFLGFDVGAVVPMGYYDAALARWVPAENGRVVRLLDGDGNGSVDGVDATGDGLPDDLDGDGATGDEAAGLADGARYRPDATYWRALIAHLTPWDANWPWGCPPPVGYCWDPDPFPLDGDEPRDPESCQETNSWVESQGRIYHDDVALPGAPFDLHYSTGRVPGHVTVVTVPASGDSVSPILQKIVVRLTIAGRTMEAELPGEPQQVATFAWDGLDHLGRPAGKVARARVEIGFVYPLVYYASSTAWAQSFGMAGTTATPIRTRAEGVWWRNMEIPVHHDRRDADLGVGWDLSVRHEIDPADPTVVYKGDGSTARQDLRPLSVFAGNYAFDAYGGNSVCSDLCYPRGMSIDAAGNLYVGDTRHHRVVRISPAGVVTPFAGTGSRGFAGDGGPALAARLAYPTAVAVDPFGNVYIHDSENLRIRRVGPDGVITTVAGSGQAGFSPDNTLATEARLGMASNYQNGIAADRWGNLYFTEHDNHRIRKVGTDRLLTTVAGTGIPGDSGDGFALTTQLEQPWALAVDGAGNLYFAEDKGVRLAVKKVTPDGRMSWVAGGGNTLTGYDIPAAQARLDKVTAVFADENGNIYFTDRSRGVCRVDAGGTLGPVSGGWQPSDLAMDRTGALYVLGSTTQVVQKLATPPNTRGYGEPGDLVFAEGGLGYVFSAAGLHTATIELESGATVLAFGYEGGRIATVADRFGNVTRVERDGEGTPTAIVAPDGQRTELAITEGRLRSVAHPDGAVHEFDYDAGGLMTGKRDPNGNRFVHEFDGQGRVTDLLDPEGGRWSWLQGRDAAGTITTSIESAEGERKTFTESRGWGGAYSSAMTAADGSSSAYSRPGDPWTERSSLQCGQTVERSFDIDPVWRHRYVSDLRAALPSGLTRRQTEARAYQDTDQDQRMDRVTVQLALNGRTATRVRDMLTGVETITSPAGRVRTLQRDPATQLVQQVSVPGLHPVQLEHDGRGRLERIIQGTRSTELSYDASGNVATITAPDGREWSLSHDPVGRLTAQRGPDGGETAFRYDGNGNLAALTTPTPAEFGFGYTANDQRRSLTAPLSGAYAYAYDRDRRLLSVTAPSGAAIVNSYAGGHLASTTTPEGTTTFEYPCSGPPGTATRGAETVSYAYDGPLVTAETRGGTLAAALAYAWNSDFAPASMTYAGATAEYGYDADGLLTSAGGFTITRSAANGLPLAVAGGGMRLERTFSGYGELDGQRWTVGGSGAYDWSAVRDAAGRVVQRSERIGGIEVQWAYGYDVAGRLASVSRDGAAVEQYAYDANGNRVTETNLLRGIAERSYEHTIEDHVVTAGPDEYAFDADGFLRSRTTPEGTTLYRYSARGELLRADLPDGTVVTYVHDPLGRRIAREVDGAIVEKYLWAGRTTLLATYDGSGALLQRYAYADARVPVSMTAGGATYFLLTDQVGTLRAVADTSGAIVKRIDYDSFGNIVADSNPSFSVPFGFAGGLHDRDTGLVRFGYRDYAPELGRFTAKDPIDFAGGDGNLYAYTMSDPINFADPSGLYERDVHYDLTFHLARKAGLSYEQALTIARADQGVDERMTTHPYNPFGGTQLHFAAWRYAIAGLEMAAANHDLEQFGFFLHVFQDTYSHEGYIWLFGGHLFSGHAPDKYNLACERDKHMRDATLYLLQQLMLTLAD